ncbi:DUF4097 family beta strand repeat-containing protein [Streptomyces sp. NPDC018045]|uniref:DUF4097 family beta strand repeat-containing protein n=1 Tax=Streptomyces sp. NPDC018045 TaxID=3365037 RepID=UPI0037914B06
MPERTEWSVSDPRTLEIDETITALHVRIVGGTVNIVGAADTGPARVEISEVSGPPLTIRREAQTLTVTYDDLPWKSLLTMVGRETWNRTAVISVTVPAATRVEVGAVGASAVVSGISGRTELRGVTGDSTLVGLTGPVRAETVSGRVEGQAVTGDLSFHSVSGDLTLLEGAGSSVRADSVSGDMVLDLDPAANGSDVRLTTVSGEVAIRLPAPGDTRVDANTAGGTVANAFEDLRVSGRWGAKRITGRLGSGSGTLKVTTVSGGLALLRRPPSEEHLGDGEAGGQRSARRTPGAAAPNDNVTANGGAAAPREPQDDSPADEKVL